MATEAYFESSKPYPVAAEWYFEGSKCFRVCADSNFESNKRNKAAKKMLADLLFL